MDPSRGQALIKGYDTTPWVTMAFIPTFNSINHLNESGFNFESDRTAYGYIFWPTRSFPVAIASYSSRDHQGVKHQVGPSEH